MGPNSSGRSAAAGNRTLLKASVTAKIVAQPLTTK